MRGRRRHGGRQGREREISELRMFSGFKEEPVSVSA